MSDPSAEEHLDVPRVREQAPPREGESSCDALVSVRKGLLTDYVRTLVPERRRSLDRALSIALGLA